MTGLKSRVVSKDGEGKSQFFIIIYNFGWQPPHIPSLTILCASMSTCLLAKARLNFERRLFNVHEETSQYLALTAQCIGTMAKNCLLIKVSKVAYFSVIKLSTPPRT